MRAWPLLCVLAVSVPCGAQEDDTTCQTSYVEGQKAYKLDHDLLRGREQLLACARTCPDQLRASCGKWLKDIESELPSIVVKAKDARGGDIASVTVDVDDAPVHPYVEGLPIDLNPGKHVVRVHKDGKAVDQTVLLNAGEKLKVVEVWLEPRAVAVTRTSRPVPVGTYVLLGVGVAALASFAAFGIWTTYEYAATSSCTPTCPASTHDGGFDAKAAIADVSLGVAGAALLASVIVYFTRPKVITRTTVGVLVSGLSVSYRF